MATDTEASLLQTKTPVRYWLMKSGPEFVSLVPIVVISFGPVRSIPVFAVTFSTAAVIGPGPVTE